MAYDQRGIAEVVLKGLTACPLMRLREVAESLHIDRHTIERALRDRLGRSFRSVQNELLRATVEQRMRDHPHESIKEMAVALGYDPSQSFSRRWRRIAGCCPIVEDAMKKIPFGVRTVLYVGGAALLLNVVRIQLSPRADAMASTGGAYTIALVEQTGNGKGATMRLASIQTWARRSDGATALKLGAGDRTSRLITLPSGLSIRTQDVIKAKSTIHVPPRGVQEQRDPNNLCKRSDDVNPAGTEEAFSGLRIAKFVEKASDRTSTTRYALDYGCPVVSRETTFSNGSVSHLRLVSFTPGEPDSALFDVPQGYAEGPPSELQTEHEKAHCPASCQAGFKRQDDEYYRLRPRE